MKRMQLEFPRIVAVSDDVLPSHWASRLKKAEARLYIAKLYENPAKTGKFYPAAAILCNGVERDDHQGAKVAIDSTSGGYGVALEVVRRQLKRIDSKFPIERVVMVVTQSLPKGKRERLANLGIELIEAKDSIDAMRVAAQVARERGYWYTNQYGNPDNSAGWRPVAEIIADQLPTIGMVAWGVGSGGGCSGVMPVFRERFKDRSFGLWRVAVVAEDGEKIGGVRDEAALEPGTLEWGGENIDAVRFVTERQSNFFCSAIWRQGFHVGPSTGFAAEGACLALRELVAKEEIDRYRAPDGDVHILIPSLDGRDPYRAEFEKMGIYWE